MLIQEYKDSLGYGVELLLNTPNEKDNLELIVKHITPVNDYYFYFDSCSKSVEKFWELVEDIKNMVEFWELAEDIEK